MSGRSQPALITLGEATATRSLEQVLWGVILLFGAFVYPKVQEWQREQQS